MYDVIVIGAGLIGSAAARYLCEMGLTVAAIGPAEPADWTTHRGVFASHYDQGRITRIIDPDPVWALLAKRSIEAYADLQARSGVHFHEPVGGLQLVHAPSDSERKHARRIGHGEEYGATYQIVDSADLAEHFPFLSFPAGYHGIWERGGAGYVNPRSLVQAQATVLEQSGGALIRETATQVTQDGDGMIVYTDAGAIHRAQKVLLATGSFTNCHDLLLGRKLKQTVKARTITLAEVDAAETERLATMPTIIMPIVDNPRLTSIYVLPPIRYPDGKWYVKLGGYYEPERHLCDLAEFHAWFSADGDSQESDNLRRALLDLIPDLRAQRFARKACAITYTDHGFPYVDAIVPGQLYVAVGGCGSAAKSSNEIGRVAALLTAHDRWVYDVPAQTFSVVYAQTPVRAQ